MIVALSILLSFLIGFLICLIAFKEYTILNMRLLLNLSLPIGIGISSVILISFNLLHLSSLQIILIELSLLAFLIFKIKPVKPIEFENIALNKLIYNPVLLFITAVYLYCWLIDAGIFFIDTVSEPNGLWDAWAMWNMKAKFISAAPYSWPDLFQMVNAESFHLDYPLLQTGYIARCWLLNGNNNVWVPAIISFIFTFCSIGLVSSSVSFFTTKTNGLIAGLILICTPFFMTMGDSQYADNTTGFFYLATIILLSFARNGASVKPKLLIIAGITAGLSAWSKNEGLLFITCLFASQLTRLFFTRRQTVLAELKYLFCGMLPILLVVVYYKIAIAPPNDIIHGQGQTTLAKLCDYSRYETVFKWYISQLGTFGRWAVNPWWLFLFGILINGISFKENKNGLISNSILLFLMLIGFFFIYIITPLDLVFHLSSSIHRLFFQLFPSFIFLYFMALKKRDNEICPSV